MEDDDDDGEEKKISGEANTHSYHIGTLWPIFASARARLGRPDQTKQASE